MAAGVPERLEVIRDRDAVEAELLGEQREAEQLRGGELLGGRLVSESKWASRRAGISYSPERWG